MRSTSPYTGFLDAVRDAALTRRALVPLYPVEGLLVLLIVVVLVGTAVPYYGASVVKARLSHHPHWMKVLQQEMVLHHSTTGTWPTSQEMRRKAERLREHGDPGIAGLTFEGGSLTVFVEEKVFNGRPADVASPERPRLSFRHADIGPGSPHVWLCGYSASINGRSPRHVPSDTNIDPLLLPPICRGSGS